MNAIWAFLVAHQTIVWLVAYYVFSNFVSALPAPTVTDGKGYRFFFSFMNGLGANITRAANSHIENSPNWRVAVNKFEGSKQENK